MISLGSNMVSYMVSIMCAYLPDSSFSSCLISSTEFGIKICTLFKSFTSVSRFFVSLDIESIVFTVFESTVSDLLSCSCGIISITGNGSLRVASLTTVVEFLLILEPLS